MRERPINQRAEEVRAILDGRKTQTRRVAKHVGRYSDGSLVRLSPDDESPCDGAVRCPYGAPGDRLWVRETFASFTRAGSRCRPTLAEYVVLSDGTQKARDGKLWPPLAEYAAGSADHIKWRPSIHMPRWASRITLEVTGVRVERLQDISESDAKAEGAREFRDLPSIHPYGQDPRWSCGDPKSTEECLSTARYAFGNLWNSINGADSWEANPWVWVVEFKRVTP